MLEAMKREDDRAPDAATTPVGDLQPLWEVLTALEAQPPPLGEWVQEEHDGVMRFPEYHSRVAMALERALWQTGVVGPFLYMELGEEIQRLRDPARLAAADFRTLRLYLTFQVRAERFCAGGGALGQLCDDGRMLVLLRRLRELDGRGQVPRGA